MDRVSEALRKWGGRAFGLLFGLLSGLVCALPAGAQSGVGTGIIATEATGKVQMQVGTTAPRPLQSGRPVEVDTVITTGPDATVALVFADGQIVALGENTRFRITAYRYTPQDPDKSGVMLNLIEGSARLVMGAIGQHDPRLVRIQVGMSTMAGAPDSGGRAADAGVTVQGALTLLEVSQGRVSLTVPSGQTVLVGSGEGAFVGADGTLIQGGMASLQSRVGQTAGGKELVGALDTMQSFAFPQRQQQTVITLVTPSTEATSGNGPAAGGPAGSSAGATGAGTSGASGATPGTTASAGDTPAAAAPLPVVDVGVNELPPTADIGPQLNLPPLASAATGTLTTGAAGGGSPCTASCN